MNLDSFIKTHDIMTADDRISESMIGDIEAAVGQPLGPQLRDYLLRFGFLLFEDVEFYGVNIRTLHNSDLVKQTNYLHQYFPKTLNLIAIENKGEGHYVLVDSSDFVFDYRSETDELSRTGTTLYEHILSRFQEAQED